MCFHILNSYRCNARERLLQCGVIHGRGFTIVHFMTL
jgi:hypothetical protein